MARSDKHHISNRYSPTMDAAFEAPDVKVKVELEVL